MDRLQQLLEDGVIDEVYSQLKTGKEAEVWLVSHRGEPVAAKLYKDRDTRSFKNDAGYKEGRVVRNTRTQRAMDKGSKFGRASAEDAWKSAEADAMFALHAAGVHVPKPVLFYDGVLLMEVIGDAEGRVAPRLVDAGLTREQAGPLYLQLRADVIRMLAADWIHGDLSEFNVLLGSHGPVIIDFPQVVTAAKNSQSERYFRRDLGNLVRFFSSVDPALAKHERDADDIWRAYVRRHLTPDYEPSDRPQHHGAKGGHPKHAERGPNAARAPQGSPRGPGNEPRGRSDSRGPQRHPQDRSDSRAPQHAPHAQQNHPRGRNDSRAPQSHPQGRNDSRSPQHEPRSPQSHPQGRNDSRAPQHEPRASQSHPQGRNDSRAPQHEPRSPQSHPQGRSDARSPQHEPRAPQSHPQGRNDSRAPQHEPRSPQSHPQGRNDSRAPQHEPRAPQSHPQGRNDGRSPQGTPRAAQNPPRGQRNDARSAPGNARGPRRGPEVLIKGAPATVSPSSTPSREEPRRDHGNGPRGEGHGGHGRGGQPGGGHRRRPPRRF